MKLIITFPIVIFYQSINKNLCLLFIEPLYKPNQSVGIVDDVSHYVFDVMEQHTGAVVATFKKYDLFPV